MKTLASAAKVIFDSREKWEAAFEMKRQMPVIIENWLAEGAEVLRNAFQQRPNNGWKCTEWGLKRDSRWFLEESGEHSVGFGFGWQDVEFHLHIEDNGSHDRSKATQLLGKAEFEPLLSVFNAEYSATPHRARNGSLCSDRTFNPFGEFQDPEERLHVLAWYAGNEKTAYVEEMLKKVTQITEDANITNLIRKLNAFSKTHSGS